MNSPALDNWHEANQQYLVASLALVEHALRRHARRSQQEAEPDKAPLAEALLEAAEKMPAPAALAILSEAFVLSPFEQGVLLMCAGMELNSTFATLCAEAQSGERTRNPTFGLALAALPDAHWSALVPTAPLRRWRLIEVGDGETLVTSPLRIDERVLHYLAGVTHLDRRLEGLLRPLPPGATELPASHHDLAQRIVALWSRPESIFPSPMIQLCGEERAGKRAIAASACAELGLQAYSISGAEIPGAVAEREALARLWEREAVFGSGALFIDCDTDQAAGNATAVQAFAASMPEMLFTSSREPLAEGHRHSLRFDVNRPRVEEQRTLWASALGPLADSLNGELEQLIAQFNLGQDSIELAGAELLSGITQLDAEPTPFADVGATTHALRDVLWDVCRTQARSRLENLAQRIEPAATWDDLVLPSFQMQTLRDIAAHARQRYKVYETWGFAQKGTRGLGISALFAGDSGTGKTMAAEVLANELRLDLYRIDLSAVVSKYIGETEKNLRRVFDAAEASGALLLFDEADALFGKRSEVKDSHDRYANIEVSYLLQRMEAYRGLAILTSNARHALDPAFLRRLRFIVQFPFPDAGGRAEIWRRIFPTATPTDGLAIEKLARLNITGGHIYNIALSAAFLAADLNEPVRMRHLLHAARSEYAKLEKTLTEAETGGWV